MQVSEILHIRPLRRALPALLLLLPAQRPQHGVVQTLSSWHPCLPKLPIEVQLQLLPCPCPGAARPEIHRPGNAGELPWTLRLTSQLNPPSRAASSRQMKEATKTSTALRPSKQRESTEHSSQTSRQRTRSSSCPASHLSACFAGKSPSQRVPLRFQKLRPHKRHHLQTRRHSRRRHLQVGSSRLPALSSPLRQALRVRLR
mmetsp:Transcript_45903/g.109327  ORF Transcript_45903/g.109327 Transcript_45903/m.109327 type:complete len:201 (+) Transcript_45903:1067-1669(+)